MQGPVPVVCARTLQDAPKRLWQGYLAHFRGKSDETGPGDVPGVRAAAENCRLHHLYDASLGLCVAADGRCLGSAGAAPEATRDAACAEQVQAQTHEARAGSQSVAHW